MHEFATNHHGLFVFFTLLLSFLSVPLLFFFIYLMIRWMMSSIRKQLETLQRSLGGNVVVSMWKGYFLQLIEDGIETRIGLTPGGRASSPTLYFQIITPLGFNLSVSKENIATRGLSKLGAMEDLKIGVPTFDDRFFILAGDKIAAMNYLLEGSRYTAIEQFFQWGFSMFQGSAKVLFVSKSHYSTADLEPGNISMYIDQVRSLKP